MRALASYEKTKRMMLLSEHLGVTVAQIEANIQINHSGRVEVTDPLTKED